MRMFQFNKLTNEEKKDYRELLSEARQAIDEVEALVVDVDDADAYCVTEMFRGHMSGIITRMESITERSAVQWELTY